MRRDFVKILNRLWNITTKSNRVQNNTCNTKILFIGNLYLLKRVETQKFGNLYQYMVHYYTVNYYLTYILPPWYFNIML